MLTVKRNHFYKKKEIEIGVNVRPQYADLPSSTASTTKLGTNSDQNIFVMGTTVPELPDYGEAEQVGAAISLYASAVETKDNRNSPELSAYKLSEDLELAEGGISLSAKGDRLSLYSVHPVNPTPYLEEDFEGNPENLDVINRMGTNNVVTSSEAYITVDDLRVIIEEREGGPIKDVLWRNFIKQVEKIDGEYRGASPGIVGNKCRVSWSNSNHTQWRIRPGYNRLLFKTKLYKYFDFDFSRGLKGLYGNPIQFNKISAAAGNIETTPQANVCNTIFDDFYATRNFSNPYDANESDPLIMTNIDLSSENSLNGGQSLRFYHNWGHSVYNPELQAQLGEAKNLNAQCARVSLYDIPFPSLPFDFARTTMPSGTTTIPVLGANHAVVPEIRLPMNISKLRPNLHVVGEAYTHPSGSPTIDPPIASLKRFYGSTTTADAASPAYSTSGPASLFENTFLRSVVVTFSNYKPKARHTTVDKFLAYGLRRFYRGETTDNIVGGFVITRFGIDGAPGIDGTNCYAYPLPVSRLPQGGAYASGTNSNDYVHINAGIAKFEGDGVMDDLDILSWGRTTATNAPESDADLRHVTLPMNSWFTARIFTDIYQHNNSGSYLKRPYAPSSSANPSFGSDGTFADVAKRGAPMRVIFETDMANQDIVTISGSTMIEIGGTPVNASTRNLPFLDIPFPIGDSGNSAAAAQTSSYNFADNPELYPKHMTIWVQNFPWVSGNSNGSGSAGNNTYDSMFYVADSNTTTSGSASEAEVFIDSVKLMGYEPEIRNVTANNSNSVLSFESDKLLSPIATRYKDTTNDEYIGSSWVEGAPLDRTIDCSVTGTTITINNPTEFDTTFLENAGFSNSNITMIDAGGILGGTKTLVSINSLTEVTINSASASDNSSVPVRFQAAGTILPRVNKANLHEYTAGQAVIFGFNDDNDLPSGDYSTNASGYVLFNDFITKDWSAMSNDVILPTKTSTQQGGTTVGGIYSQASASMGIDKLGGQLLGESAFIAGTNNSNISGAAYKVAGGATATTNAIALGTGSNNDFISIDGFRQKGFVKVNFSGSSSNYAKWVKRENIMLSTRVVNCKDKSIKNNEKVDGYKDDLADNQIKVKNINIFNYFDNEEKYMIYLVGDADATKSKKTGLILDRTKPPVNNIVEFTNLTSFADDGKTALITEGNLHRLMVCPEKFTLSMLFDTPSDRIKRSYSSVCTVAETPSMSSLSTVSGTTFNEFTFNYDSSPTGTGGATGLYKNNWSLVVDENNSTVVTDRDYGYGSYDEETSSGGEFFKGPAYLDTYNYYKLKNFDVDEKANLNIALFYQTDLGTDESITFETDDSSTAVKRPILYTEYKDLPPVIKNFRVSPVVNTLTKDFNYYDITDENLNAVQFDWSEENADDIWYRMLLVDTEAIKDKYHRAQTYIPLNEPVADMNAAPPAGSIEAYNRTNGYSATATSVVTIGSSTRKVVDGQGGYALQTADNTNGKVTITPNTNMPGFNLTPSDYTIVLHWTPSAADKGSQAFAFTVGTNVVLSGISIGGAGKFAIYKDANDKIIAHNQNTRITGTTAIKCDGETPVSVIVVKKSGNGYAELYVNGQLDGISTSAWHDIDTSPLTIGGCHNSLQRGSTGTFEEIIIYDRGYDVVSNPNKYIYSTEDLEDYSSGIITHNALLVAADYHNFRGTSNRYIGMSTNTSWRATIV